MNPLPRVVLVAALSLQGLAACSLNPQPLPPDPDDTSTSGDPEELDKTGGPCGKGGGAPGSGGAGGSGGSGGSGGCDR